MKKMIWFALLLTGCRGIRDWPRPPVPSPVITDRGPTEKLPAEVLPDSVRVAPREEPRATELKVETRLKPESERIAELNGEMVDAYFAYDRADLGPDALAVLRRDATLLCAILGDFPGLKVIVEGHCDERGSAEYNLGLGERRARRAEEVLREYGVPASAIEVVSYGKEVPQCTEATENCRQKNRRAHLSVGGAGDSPAQASGPR